jgi:excisionase family DNA binding protein
MENIFALIRNKQEFFDALNEWEASKKLPSKKEVKDTEEIYFTQREAAKFLKVSLPTLISWKKGKKIPYYQHGRKVLFKKSEILETMRNSID